MTITNIETKNTYEALKAFVTINTFEDLYLVNDTPSSIDAIASNKTVLFFKILYDFKHSVLYEFYATVTLSNIEWCCCCD